MTITIYTSPEGIEYTALPTTWGNATNITEPWALAHGWTKAEREQPDPTPPPRRYSKYALHLALDRVGIWDAAWGAIYSAGYSQYWNDAQQLSSDDAVFAAALSALSAAVDTGAIALPEGATIESLLEEAEI